MPKPNATQRLYMAGCAPNSLLGRATPEQRKRLKAAMDKDWKEQAAYERTLRWGSEPRHG